MRAATGWAELHCHSSYSFLDGASSPEELVDEAVRLGLAALAITDHDGMYGVPAVRPGGAQGHRAWRTVFGAELTPRPARAAGRACPTRAAATCWCWPATRRATGGCAR